MSCIENRQNCKGIAETIKGKRLVVVDYQDDTGFFFCRDLETNQKYRIFRQNITFMPTIPSRFREAHFAAVAHIWAEAMDAFPNKVKAKITSHSVETLARKLREAREAKNIYKWTSPLIDDEQWEQLNQRISIEPDAQNDCVILGGKEQKKNEKAAKEVIVELKQEDKGRPLIHLTVQNDDIEKVCLLLHNKCFDPKPIFIVRNLTKDAVASLESRYDIAFISKNGSDWEIL